MPSFEGAPARTILWRDGCSLSAIARSMDAGDMRTAWDRLIKLDTDIKDHIPPQIFDLFAQGFDKVSLDN